LHPPSTWSSPTQRKLGKEATDNAEDKSASIDNLDQERATSAVEGGGSILKSKTDKEKIQMFKGTIAKSKKEATNQRLEKASLKFENSNP
jgi:hypothetical protein